MERERWSELSAAIFDVARAVKSDPRATHPIDLIVRVYLWAVLHDRPVCWACDPRNWDRRTRPKALPSQPTMSRRTRSEAFDRFLAALARRLRGRDLPALIKRIDGKALPVAIHSKDPDAKIGRGTGGLQKGYKLHAVCGEAPMPEAFEIQPLNVDERVVAVRLMGELRGRGEGYVLADVNYDSNAVHDAALARGCQLLAYRRKDRRYTSTARRRHSPGRLRSIDLLEPGPNRPCAFGRGMLANRRAIERTFGNATWFGGGLTLPPFVRRLHRVRAWVTAKLLINAARIRRRRHTRVA
jgi:hypothetical protein